jgi:hypothetical protein
MAAFRAENDCSVATPGSTNTGCDDLHARVMGAPTKAAAPDAAAASTSQKVVVQVEFKQAEPPKEPEHLKVHHNPFSVVAHAVGHFGKQYALGVKDSVEPRNLGRMTLPVGIGVGTQLVVAHEMAQGLKSGFNQVGAGMNKLGQGEASLAANQAQIAQQMTLLQQEITALQGASGASKVIGGLGKSAGVMKESGAISVASPRISTSVAQEVMVPAAPAGSAIPAVSESAVLVPGSSVAGTAAVAGSGGAKLLMARDTAPSIVPDGNADSKDFNVGVDANGFSVPMTPKQLAKANDYAAASQVSESDLARSGLEFDAQFGRIAAMMSGDKGSAAFFNDLKMRYQYAMAYGQSGDHASARAYLSDCKQDTDNLKRMAKADRDDAAVAELDGLKQTVNHVDDIEKHFKKRPAVVLAGNDSARA